MRPASIIWFERLFLGSIAVGLAASVVTAPLRAAIVDVQTGGGMGMAMIGGWTIVIVLVNLAIWWFTARAASGIARWIAVATAAVSAVLLLFGLIGIAQTRGVLQLGSGISTIAQILCIAAVAFLFKPDARAFFGDGMEPEA